MASLRLRIPPVPVAVLFGGCMWLVDRLTPGLRVEFAARRPIAWTLGAIAALLAAAGIVEILRSRTTVDPRHPEKASALVTSGVYRCTRNPMYVGLLVLLAAYAVHLSNPVTLIVLPLFVAYMNRFQIRPEEEALSAAFGDAYAEYRRRVRRWL